MYACVLIPKSLSLVLSLHSNPASVLEMSAAVWSNVHLTPGTLLHPEEGELRLDKLEIYGVLSEGDIRRKYGCFDAIHEVDGQKVRHCNWIRFVRASNDPEKVNVISSKVKGHPFFQVTKFIKPNDELVALFPDDDGDDSALSDEAKHVTSSSPERHSLDVSHPKQESGEEGQQASDSEDEKADEKATSHLPVPEDLSHSTCQEFTHSEDKGPRQFEDDSSDECEGGNMDIPARDESETDVGFPREALGKNPQPAETDEPRQDFDKTPSPREDRVSLCEAYEELPCRLTPPILPTVSLPDPQQPPDGAPGRRGRERTWWPCDMCPKKFDRPSLLKRHIRTHTGEKPHACDVCGKAFSTSSSLNTHRRIHSGEKPHQCPVCGKRFTASSNLYYHRMTHNKEKPHKCQLCSKSFPTPGDLRSHMYVHSGSWPYRCDVCNRGFSKHTNLRNHVLLHSGDKPHVCSTCGKRFALLCNLRTHLKTHAGEASPSCCKCGQAFSDNLKMASEGLCLRCSEDSGETNSQKRKENLPRESKSDFSISKLTAKSPLKPHVANIPPDGISSASISSSLSTTASATSPVYGQFHGHRPWLSPVTASPISCTSSPVITSGSSLTSPSGISCGLNVIPAVPPYLFLSSKTSAGPPAFFAPEVMSRESFMHIAHRSSSYYSSPASGTWKQQIIGQAF